MKKVKEWKAGCGPHQFRLGPNKSLIRLKDGESFLLFTDYHSYGKERGTRIELIEHHEDMIHVFYTDISPDGSIESGWNPINDIYKYTSSDGSMYLQILDRSTIANTGTAICYSD